MLDAARDQACINCGVRDGTVVAAHYTGLRAHSFGKGTGHKVHDLCVADLCSKCHEAFDRHDKKSTAKTPYDQKIDLSEQFLYLIIKTLMRRIDQEVIKVKGYE
jgi:hypothetical protein